MSDSALIVSDFRLITNMQCCRRAKGMHDTDEGNAGFSGLNWSRTSSHVQPEDVSTSSTSFMVLLFPGYAMMVGYELCCQAFRKLALLLHPDKNRAPAATEVSAHWGGWVHAHGTSQGQT